ncbi:MAG: hypothetical protein QM760_09060 [Nibricoccus sp.]
MTPAPFPVTLQISLAPGDHRLAEKLLTHQVEFWRRGVSEILLTIDTRRSHGRFGEDWKKGRQRILEIAAAIPGARVVEVDYSRESRHAVGDEFFGNTHVPSKDWRGGPYYAYFFGLHSARNDFVLHSDSDIFFGGDGLRWLEAALPLYSTQTDLLFASPLPGPPSPDGNLKQLTASRVTLGGIDGYDFAGMSTRVFLFSRTRFRERITALHPKSPAMRARVIALLDGNPAQELPENLFTETMHQLGLKRFDFAGPAPGCWTLHPPYRSEDFFNKLPDLIARIEKSDLPFAQLGDHDFNASLVDWSEAITRMAHRRWWHRLRDRIWK